MSDDFEDDFPEVDVEGVDPNKVSSHVTVDKPGKYHFGIVDVRPRLERSTDRGSQRRQDILVTCEVLESVSGQSPRGSLYFHSIPLSSKGGAALDDWGRERLSAFLIGIGILRKSEGNSVIDPETGSTAVNARTIPERLQRVAQFIGNIRLVKSDDDQYPDRYELDRGRGAFLVDDPSVIDVPKSISALKAIGKEFAAAPAATAKTPAKGTGRRSTKPSDSTADASRGNEVAASTAAESTPGGPGEFDDL